MNLIHLGYCAKLAYMIHVNEFGTTPAINHAILAWFILAW